jgi:hypothetical protein
MPDDILDLSDDPKFRVKINGEVKEYDPFAVLAKVRDLDLDPSESGDGEKVKSFEASVDAVREAFGLPTLASGDPTVSAALALKLYAGLMKFIKGLSESLKNEFGGQAATPS